MTQSLLQTTTLMSMGQEILDRTVSCLVQQGLTVPTRQLVYVSPIATDCEQVVVLFSGWSPQPPWNGLAACSDFRWCGQFTIGITRCTPAMPGNRAAPTVGAMEAAAQIASADAEALLLLASSFEEVGSELAVMTPGPEGGFQTVALSVMLPAFGGLG